jgi:hypothetical protein
MVETARILTVLRQSDQTPVTVPTRLRLAIAVSAPLHQWVRAIDKELSPIHKEIHFD